MSRLLQPTEDLQAGDLPPKTLSNWQMTGPGAILVGLSIGAGEIIIWPRMVAEHGATIIWAAFWGVFLQLWINLEVGRWTIATGETVYSSFSRVWRGFAPLFILFNVLGWLAPGWARASGSALKALLVGPDWHMHSASTGVTSAADFWGTDTCWTAITFALVALALFGPKVVYQSVERTIEVLVIIVVVGLASVAVAVGTKETTWAMAQGLTRFGQIPDGLNAKDLFIAVVFAGAGGTANLFYTFYLRDKHIGMGARIPSMTNALRGRSEKIPTTGFRYADTEQNGRRFSDWWSFIWQDQLLFFLLLNCFTLMLFIYGALAVLHPQGRVPEAGRLIWDEAQILNQVWGPVGRTIFLCVGLATLFSTQLAVVDGVARSLADIIYTSFPAARCREVSWWYLVVAGLWIVVGIGLTAVLEFCQINELGFLFNAAYMGGFAMAVYVPLLLYVNLRYLPRSARPGWINVVMMLGASLVYLGFAARCIAWELSRALAF